MRKFGKNVGEGGVNISYKDITKEKLIELYLKEDLTENQIAKIFNCSQTTVGNYRKKWKIATEGIKNYYEIEKDIVKIQIKFKNNYYYTIVDRIIFQNKIKKYKVKWYGHDRRGCVYITARNEYKNGFAHEYVKTEQFDLHRLVMGYPNVGKKGYEIDHINGDTLDNRKGNLRKISHADNMKNKKRYSNNSSGFNGVGLCKRNKYKQWYASIRINNKDIHLGYFKTKEEAIKARKKADKKYFKEYHRKFI